MEVVGYGMTKACADSVFSQAGFSEGQGRDQVGVVELHDCFAANEVEIFQLSHELYLIICDAVDHLSCSRTLPSWRCSQACRTRRQHCKCTATVCHTLIRHCS